MRISLVDLYDRYHKPLFIVENGIGANDLLIDGKVHDPYRIDYYREHINAMRDATIAKEKYEKILQLASLRSSMQESKSE